MAAQNLPRLELPGFTLPLNYRPPGPRYETGFFPNALDYNDIDNDYFGRNDTLREISMMRVMNFITDKPEWDRKVFDDKITSKWREEIAESSMDISPKMMKFMLKELQWKAEFFHERGFVDAFENGVVKSDTAVSQELQRALRKAVLPLEQVPKEQKDYHPGSDMKVVDLVHPSLFPVIYGRTRILPNDVLKLDDCLSSVGQGELLPVPSKDDCNNANYPAYEWSSRTPNGFRAYSRKFQWLPCDVEFTEDEGCRIVSYINNAHPNEHRALYEVVEKIIARAVPLWNQSLAKIKSEYHRIEYHEVDFLPHPDPEPELAEGEDEDDDEYWEKMEKWEEARPIELPEPEEFTKPPKDKWANVNLREQFREPGLQVIVKLANIELTPENPEYEGGSWHIEGQLNERICATAIYYYDNENITNSTLSFRQRASTDDIAEIGYPQARHEFLHTVYGFGDGVHSYNYPITQDIGGVVSREGRLLTFPNILQHRVSPFKLADPLKPGHRKILALFLVDPNRRVISSANVPPQQEDWGKEKHELVETLLAQRLPVELQQMVNQDLSASFITMSEAKEYRLQLMEERGGWGKEQNEDFETGDFNLCEH